jgi:GTPase SAR1 family protein
MSCDTPSGNNEKNSKARSVIYLNTQTFIICFSVDSLSSYTNIEKIWIEEIKELVGVVPIILVGTKIDIRENSKDKKKFVSTKQVRKKKLFFFFN